MFTLVITGPDRAQARHVLEDREVTIGRIEGNHIVLADPNVSRRHARLVVRDGRYILVDLESTNGTEKTGAEKTRTTLSARKRIDQRPGRGHTSTPHVASVRQLTG